MSIFKDWHDDTKDYHFTYKFKSLVNPREWLRLHKWRKQRADRGWSDRDTWGAGDHIARMTAQMLQHLNDHTYIDWPEWFKLNVKEEGKGAYKNLQSVVDDIIGYLDFTETNGWAEDLHTQPGDGGVFNHTWHYPNGRKLNDAEITGRIKSYAAKEAKLYNKAKKAMGFFARHFSGFWD